MIAHAAEDTTSIDRSAQPGSTTDAKLNWVTPFDSLLRLISTLEMYRLLDLSSPESASDDSSQYEAIIIHRNWYNITYLPIIICLVCTIINAAFTAHFEFNKSLPLRATPFSAKYTSHLRRPSQFIRFNEVSRPSPPVEKQFINYPITLTRIDSVRKDKVFEDDPRRYMSHLGTISAQDRRVLVTDVVSTVIQFRAYDWGMESCELRLFLPRVNSSGLLPLGQSFPLSLYQLNTTTALDVSELSYATRPPRASKLANIPFTHGQETFWSRTFFCETEQLLTFELECSGFEGDNQCHIDWWQDQKVKPTDPAIYMVQHSTA